VPKGPKPKTCQNSKPNPTNVITEYPVPASLDDVGKQEFVRLMGLLQSRGTLEQTDLRVIEEAAAAVSELVVMRASIADQGMTITAANGTLIPHPLLGMVNRTSSRLRGLLNDLGMSPKHSRHGGQASSSSNTSDPWDGLLGVVG
jgi:P27 family predicted phage terminase small subunit